MDEINVLMFNTINIKLFILCRVPLINFGPELAA